MPRRRIRAGLILVTVILGGGAAFGAERPAKSVAPRPLSRTPYHAPSAFLQGLRGLWERAGSYIDPFGNPVQSPPPPGGAIPAGDAGSYIDPFGYH